MTDRLSESSTSRLPTVLVVDDEPDLRDVVRLLLEAEGFSVATASDGQQAIDQVVKVRPDLILLDMGLPLLNGEEVAARLRATQDTMPPIIVMSAAGTIAERARRVGAMGYIEKPFDLDHIVDAVHSAFEQIRRDNKHTRSDV